MSAGFNSPGRRGHFLPVRVVNGVVNGKTFSVKMNHAPETHRSGSGDLWEVIAIYTHDLFSSAFETTKHTRTLDFA